MKFRQKIWIFVVVLTTFLTFGNASSIFDHDSEIGLLNYMARSNDLLLQDPARSLSCFNKYLPLINAIAKNYETNFQACLNESEAASAKADEATLEERNELANAAEASCALLKQCQEENSVGGIFQCYIDGGSANIQTMYLINANASQDLAALREQYYLIRNDEYKCTNATKRAYEKESAEAYAGLNNCILGNSDAEQPATTEKTTTDAPTQTTEDTTISDDPVAPIETTSESPEESSTLPEATTDIPTEATEEPETSDSPVTTTAPEETTSENPEE